MSPFFPLFLFFWVLPLTFPLNESIFLSLPPSLPPSPSLSLTSKIVEIQFQTPAIKWIHFVDVSFERAAPLPAQRRTKDQPANQERNALNVPLEGDNHGVGCSENTTQAPCCAFWELRQAPIPKDAGGADSRKRHWSHCSPCATGTRFGGRGSGPPRRRCRRRRRPASGIRRRREGLGALRAFRDA